MSLKAKIKKRLPWLLPLLRRFPIVLRSIKRLISYFQTIRFRLLAKPCINRHYDEVQLRKLFLLARSSGLFDAQYYSDHQKRIFRNDYEGFSDYMDKAFFSCVNPSACFDTAAYYKCNPDIYHKGINALEHYLLHGKNEGRTAPKVRLAWRAKDAMEIPENLVVEQNIAVCLHIFYADFIDYYAQALEDFPQSVDLFITVSSKEHLVAIDKKLAKLKTVNKVKTRVVPNRGRNFGPFLVEFAAELQSYDLLCHLHSKKSLYSGRQQTQWLII